MPFWPETGASIRAGVFEGGQHVFVLSVENLLPKASILVKVHVFKGLCREVSASKADRDSFEGKRLSPWNLELRHNGFLERTKTAMGSLAESVREQPAMPRLEDGSVNLRELMRRIAEDVANAIMDAEADRLCAGGVNSRNGYRERNLVTCVS